MFGFFKSAPDKPESPVPASGPDDPVCSRDRDSLRRWKVAQSIMDLVEGTPPDWSLRIGVFGRWGQGKSSVLQFVRAIASQRSGYVVAAFNPWLARDIREMWFGLTYAICEAVDPDAARKLKRSAFLVDLYSKGLKVAELKSGAKPAAEVLGSFFLPFLDVTREKLEELLNQKLDNRRLVVLLDDIDRADAALVPVLLLGLREALALKRCVFVVALDSTVVAKALPEVHPGWAPTEEFLEKIIDYEVRLDDPVPEDRLRLATQELDAFQGLGLKPEMLADIVDLLPANPRRLKRFMRGLPRFKPTLARCDPDEVQWLIVLFLDLMKTACPPVAARMFASEELLGTLAAAKARLRESLLSELLEKIGALFPSETAEEERHKFEGLIKAFTERAPFIGQSTVVKWARVVAGEPLLLTDKEARHLIDACDTAQKLSDWTQSQATTLGVTSAEVQRAIVQGMLDERGVALEQRYRASIQAESEAFEQTASRALTRIRALACELHGFASASLSAAEFMAIYGQAVTWVEMRQDSAQSGAREEEKQLLLDAARDAGPLAATILEGLQVGSFFPDLTGSEQARTLRDQIVHALSPSVIQDLLARFGREAGISSLARADRHLVERFFLLRKESPLYDEAGRARLKELAGSAKTDHHVQLNFVEFLDLLSERLEHDESAKALAADTEVVGTAWMAATSRPLQPRVVADLEKSRKVFAELLGGEWALPLPGWWEAPRRQPPQPQAPTESHQADTGEQALGEAAGSKSQ